MAQTRVVIFTDEEHEFYLVVSEADYFMDLVRTVLLEQVASEVNAAGNLERVAPSLLSEQTPLYRNLESLLRISFYPPMIASVVEQRGFKEWPVPFEEFMHLPRSFMVEWEQATFELNEHWKTRIPEPAKKKMSTLEESNPSSNGSKSRRRTRRSSTQTMKS